MDLRGVPHWGFPRGIRHFGASIAFMLLSALGGEGVRPFNQTEHEIMRRHAAYNPLGLEGLSLLQEAMRQDSPCTMPHGVSEDDCLKRDLQCSWIKRSTTSICVPCEFGGIDIPCPPIQSYYDGGQVEMCTMNCAHQKTLSLGIGACTDTSGSISVTNCMEKGSTVDPVQKCMWTSYVDKNGAGKSICGPCNVAGIGEIPCGKLAEIGPEGPGSSVTGCASSCSGFGLGATKDGVPCGGPPWNKPAAVTPCFNVPAPAPPPKGTVPLPVFEIHTTPDAPDYFATYVDKPYGLRQWTEAAALAAHSAGWPPGSYLPPDAAVVIYGPPPNEGPTLPPTMKVMYGPAPPGIPGVPPPGYGVGTVPPAANIKAAENQGFLQVHDHVARQKPTMSPPSLIFSEHPKRGIKDEMNLHAQ